MRIDDDGVCSACHNAANRAEVDYARRQATLNEILQVSRRQTTYDCVVPWSGGKDSSTVALRLREELGLRPLLVNFSPLIPTREGEENKAALLDLGFDSIVVQPSRSTSRDLARRFFIERGDPKVHWTAGINASPVRIAVSLGIPLVFYAEHGESEYGGRVLSERHLMERDLDEVLEHQIGDDPVNWATGEIQSADLYPYSYPDREEIQRASVRSLYFGYFFPWDVTENYNYVSSMLQFRGNHRGRTYGTFNDYDSVDDVMDDLYYYMQFIKFGFGRCLRDCARMIQRGHMNREQAASLIDKFDGEFPEETIGICLDYLGMPMSEFQNVVNRHRSPRVWKEDAGSWTLRTSPLDAMDADSQVSRLREPGRRPASLNP
jgi:N-acetyl sugar amidotransferase